MNRTLLVATILTFAVALVAGTNVIEVANANFLPSEKPTNWPPIIIHSPQNATVYSQNDLLLNFTIVGIARVFPVGYTLKSVYYEFYGNTVYLLTDGTENIEQFSASLSVGRGTHNLTVHITGTGKYRDYTKPQPQFNIGYSLADYSVESIQTVTFSVDKNLEVSFSPIPSATSQQTLPPPEIHNASLPSPTIQPTPITSPSSSPTSSPSPSIPEFPALLTAPLFFACAFLVICWKRRKRNE